MPIEINVNGKTSSLDVDPATPLLYVLRNDLSLREEGGYMAKKTLVGSQRCFERIPITLTFDGNRQLADR